MDLEKGKQIFFRFNGSRFHIDRECPDEYKKCGVPKSVEQQWLEEIKIDFLKNISVESGHSKVILINNYIQLLDNESAVHFVIKVLNQTDLDTFSMIILAETLKHYKSTYISEQLKQEIYKLLLILKKIMLNGEIKIDESYKKDSYMKDYDFTKENIINRINKL